MSTPDSSKGQDYYKRVILHIDLDCFYAQVEHNRLQIPMSVPLAVQQWNGLIAVNYSARNFGVKRHTPVLEALSLCPQLRLVHVPTYSLDSISTSSDDLEELTAIPRYHDQMSSFRSDGTRLSQPLPDPGSNKACLEPYRQASILIFRILKDWCSTLAPGTLLEKGGLDEAFLDITDEVEEQLIEEFDSKYTMIRDELIDIENEELEAEALENLSLYNTQWIDNLDYTGLGERVGVDDTIKDDADSTTEVDLVDKMRKLLGKLRIWKGCQLARTLRSRLRTEINYIASIGIAPNKMLSKLVSAIFKPDKQTRIEPAQISDFMKQVPFEKIRMMGGKIGQRVLKARENDSGNNNEEEEDNEVEEEEFEMNEKYDDLTNRSVNNNSNNTINTSNSAADLWPLSVTELANRLGDRVTAQWIYNLIRGIDTSPLTPRSQIKSFMSAKAFRPAIKDWPSLHDWCVVLVGELWSRMQEEKEQSSRWPATMTVYWRAYVPGTTRMRWSNVGAVSKSCEFPFASSMPLQATPKSFLEVIFKIFKGQKDPSRSRPSSTSMPAANNGNNVTSMSKHSTSEPVALFPMSYLAISVSNFKSLESDGKARPTRVDQFFSKSSEVKELPPSMEHLFEKKCIIPSHKENVNIIEAVNVTSSSKKKNKSVLELLQQQQSRVPVKITEEPIEEKPAVIFSKESKPKRPKSGGILDFFPKQPTLAKPTRAGKDQQMFSCKKCSFFCDLSESRSIQEHEDFHLAVELSKQL